VPKLEPEEALIRASLAALRPFVRRLLHRGVAFGQLEKRMRELFVEVAETDMAGANGRQTDSRIAVLTGLNRKEVRRIRREDGKPAPATFSRNLASSLVSRWMTDPAAISSTGRPLSIPYDADRGPSFVRFAEAVTHDLGPRALLQVLIDSGAAETRKGDKVALLRAAYIPERGRPEGLAMLADDPPELIETMLVNVIDENVERRLQQKLAFDNLGSEGVAKLRVKLRREAERFLEKANEAFLRLDRDRTPDAPGGARTYAGIGVYYFESMFDSDAAVETQKPGRRTKGRKTR
jgi:hypothetical protein